MTDSEKLDLLLVKMQDMETEMQDMKTEMQGMETEMQGMETEMQGMKTEMQDIKSDLHEVMQKVAKTEMILENEIRVNIQRVAEGHFDLSRNLHDAMKPSSEVEMLAIKIRMLESDVKELKAKLA